MKMEYRKLGEIRKTTEEGVVEAYLTAWDTVDSYTTSFQRGCFTKTFKERGNKIRLIWNHEKLAGKILECREDDFGPLVVAKFNLDTQAGREGFAHVRDGDVDCFSFGFNSIQSEIINKVRTFTEVRCMECGPVIFEANGAASITGVRAEDFDQTVKDNEIANRGWKLFNALKQTIDDIYWSEDYNKESIISKIDAAISAFHGSYMEWLSEYYASFKERAATYKHLTRKGNIIQEAIKSSDQEMLARTTSLTESDVEQLKNGKLLTDEARSKLADLPDDLREAHQEHRKALVESLCTEFRSLGFSEAERQRFAALLGIEKEDQDLGGDYTSALNGIVALHNKLK